VSHKEGHLIPPNRQSNLSADAEAREPGIGARYVPKAIVEIECAEVWRQISNYLDDDVDPGLRANMSSHFNNCAHCSAILDGARNVVKLVGDGRAFEIPAAAGQRFYKKLNDHLAARQRARG
jgi:Putative zinc-finger